MNSKVLKVHPADNVLVALTNLEKGSEIEFEGTKYLLQDHIAAKHKFVTSSLQVGDPIIMYGVLVGKAQHDIPLGGLISTANVMHASNDFTTGQRKTSWQAPNVDKWKDRTFMGFHRNDGSVGTSNYWLVIPLVFCENRNLDVLQEALVKDLGYGRNAKYQKQARQLIDLYRLGKTAEEILTTDLLEGSALEHTDQLFPNVDGIKFLSHNGGCGGTRQDSQALCGLLAGYITHPNVAGATILSLGCQNAQVAILQEEIQTRSPNFDKPLIVLEQQKIGTESALLSEAIIKTFAG
ncbi:MAG: UxaA family hydrolase, partial [Chitinophagaceae bacterium]